MKNLLIVSPHFPPVNAADMHRVRLSLSFFLDNNWKPYVLCIDPKYIESGEDKLLLETVPRDIPVSKVKALSSNVTKKLGVRNPSLRAIPYLYSKGLEMIKNNSIDLVYFSTTAFHILILGRIWKKKTGIPYVIDMQDPWYSKQNYKENFSNTIKYSFNKWIHKYLEKWTMDEVDGIISVSRDYIDKLKIRYPKLVHIPSKTITFGASDIDFKILSRNSVKNIFFTNKSDSIYGVYVGRGGKDMEFSLKIIFSAFNIGLDTKPDIFSKIKLYFIGTDYAPDDLIAKSIEPIARAFNLENYVDEFPKRIPYFETLKILADSDFLLIPGSNDKQYTASKIYPYIMARKPLLCVFHENSSVVDIINSTNSGRMVTFLDNTEFENYSFDFYTNWLDLLENLSTVPNTDWVKFKPYTAEETTKRQCCLFDEVITNGQN